MLDFLPHPLDEGAIRQPMVEDRFSCWSAASNPARLSQYYPAAAATKHATQSVRVDGSDATKNVHFPRPLQNMPKLKLDIF